MEIRFPIGKVKTVFFFFKFHLFIYFGLCWVFVAACRLSLVAKRSFILVASLVAEHGLWGIQA